MHGKPSVFVNHLRLAQFFFFTSMHFEDLDSDCLESIIECILYEGTLREVIHLIRVNRIIKYVTLDICKRAEHVGNAFFSGATSELYYVLVYFPSLKTCPIFTTGKLINTSEARILCRRFDIVHLMHMEPCAFIYAWNLLSLGKVSKVYLHVNFPLIGDVIKQKMCSKIFCDEIILHFPFAHPIKELRRNVYNLKTFLRTTVVANRICSLNASVVFLPAIPPSNIITVMGSYYNNLYDKLWYPTGYSAEYYQCFIFLRLI
jgi:hypothetical protein